MSFDGDLYPTAGADVVMTTKGDMVDYNTSRQRLGIGSANQILQVKSGLPSWETLSTAGSVLTTQGDVLYEGAAGLARLGFGTSGDVLTTKGTGANPVWQTPTSSAVTEVLYDTTASGGATTSLEMDRSADPLLASDYPYFDIWFQMSPDASMDVNFVIDQKNTNEYYSRANQYASDGTVTWIIQSGSATGTIADTTIMDSPNDASIFHGVMGFNPKYNTFNGFWDCFQYANGQTQKTMFNGWTILSVANQVSYLGMSASASFFQDGSRLVILGYKTT